jgi:hypothetical protein
MNARGTSQLRHLTRLALHPGVFGKGETYFTPMRPPTRPSQQVACLTRASLVRSERTAHFRGVKEPKNEFDSPADTHKPRSRLLAVAMVIGGTLALVGLWLLKPWI